MRLYHSPMSSNARRAVMTALYLDVDLELVTVDLRKGEQKAPEYLARNPNGKVPVLEDDGFILTESHAIMQYLTDKAALTDKKSRAEAIYPSGLKKRADVNRWLFWSAHHFQPTASILNWERFVKPMLGLPEDPAEIAKGNERIAILLDVLEHHLEGKKWVLGDDLTLADLALATPLATAEKCAIPVAHYTNVARWFERVRELEVWKRTGM